MVDALVVGGGPAGLAAAGWLGRYRRSVVLVDAGEPRNRWVKKAHGYLALDPADPSEIKERAEAEINRYPTVTTQQGRVLSIEGSIDAFAAQLADGTQVDARRVVLATGVVDVFPEVKGFFDHYGTSVFHCSSCDGYEARDQAIVVLGWREHVADFALGLLDWASKVTVVTDGRRFEGDAHERDRLQRYGVALHEDDAVELEEADSSLVGVRLRGGGRVDCSMVFFSIGHVPQNDLATSLACELTGDGCVITDDSGTTTAPGVYAAGDLTPGIQLISVASAKGAVAGITCALSLTPDRE